MEKHTVFMDWNTQNSRHVNSQTDIQDLLTE